MLLRKLPRPPLRLSPEHVAPERGNFKLHQQASTMCQTRWSGKRCVPLPTPGRALLLVLVSLLPLGCTIVLVRNCCFDPLLMRCLLAYTGHAKCRPCAHGVLWPGLRSHLPSARYCSLHARKVFFISSHTRERAQELRGHPGEGPLGPTFVFGYGWCGCKGHSRCVELLCYREAL